MGAPFGDHAAQHPVPRYKKKRASRAASSVAEPHSENTPAPYHPPAPQGENAATHRTATTPIVTEHTRGQNHGGAAQPDRGLPADYGQSNRQGLTAADLAAARRHASLYETAHMGGGDPFGRLDALAGSPLESTGALMAHPIRTLFPQPKRDAHGNVLPFDQQPVNIGMIPYGSTSEASAFAKSFRASEAYKPRMLKVNGLETQLPKSRSRLVARPIAKAADFISNKLEGSDRVKNIPLLRITTASDRITKAAGRAQRQEMARLTPEAHGALRTIAHVKEGSPEDVANFWYAQLPKEYRNAEGLKLVVDKQKAEMERISSGQAAAELDAREAAVKAELSQAATGGQFGHLMRQLEEIKLQKTDLPQRLEDTSASVGHLSGLIEHAPAPNEDAINAVHVLSGERQGILSDAGKLKDERGANRKGLVARWLGFRDHGSIPRVLPVETDPVIRHTSVRLPLDEQARIMPKDGQHLYHSTSIDSLGDIARDGLKPGKERRGEITGVYFGQDWADINSLRPAGKRPGDVILRVDQSKVKTEVTDMYEQSSGFEEHVSRDPVPASVLEYFGSDGSWHPISDAVGAVGHYDSNDLAYIGHRLPKPGGKFSGKVSGGTGRPAVPQGVGSQNRLSLATTGRLRPSLRVAAEDWQSAQAFKQANVARDDLGKLGSPYNHARGLPDGHVLVNPKGRTIPANWKTESFAQFSDDYGSTEDIRQKAQEVLSGFLADPKRDPAAVDQMLYDASESGVNYGELRTVPKRLVDRYYSQFRRTSTATKGGKVYDRAVDAVATSIVFARVGYIPKNLVQNVIMAVPHQGPLLLVNAVKAAQAMADPELRVLLRQEVGFSGATHGLGNEAASSKVLGKVAHFVGMAADDPMRMSAFLHEAAAEGVVSRFNPLLTQKDLDSLKRLLTHKSQRAKLNDIRSRAVEAMADFSRLTPDQAHLARRLLVIPGWLMAGSRYPVHFAVNHPIRSALLAYIAMGEPGAPEELRFNKPVDEYFQHGLPPWVQGIPFGGKIERTNSINPVSTPWEIAGALAGHSPQTAADYANPTFSAIYNIANRTVSGPNGPYRVGFEKSLEKNALNLVPNYAFAHGMIDPQASKTYPEDATRAGRLKRELGIVPIEVNPAAVTASASDKADQWLVHAKNLAAQHGQHNIDWATVGKQKHLRVIYEEQTKRLKDHLGIKSGDPGLNERQLAAVKLHIGAQDGPPYIRQQEQELRAALETGDPAKVHAVNLWLDSHMYGELNKVTDWVGTVTAADKEQKYRQAHGG